MNVKARILTTLGSIAWVGSVMAALSALQILSNAGLAAQAREAHPWPDRPTRELTFVHLEQWRAIKNRDDLYVLDVRTRQAFARGHVLGAVNIPLHELEMRAIAEIPKDANVVVYCAYDENCEEKFRIAGQSTPCTDVASLLLDRFGFERTRILAVEEEVLLASGTVFASYDFRLVHERLNS